MWERLGIAVDFTVLKHKMGDARTQFEADEYVHVGSADRDTHYTELSGFAFVHASNAAGEPWALDSEGVAIAPNTSELSPTERARLSGS
jgi:hypothetical protein